MVIKTIFRAMTRHYCRVTETLEEKNVKEIKEEGKARLSQIVMLREYFQDDPKFSEDR